MALRKFKLRIPSCARITRCEVDWEVQHFWVTRKGAAATFRITHDRKCIFHNLTVRVNIHIVMWNIGNSIHVNVCWRVDYSSFSRKRSKECSSDT